MSHINTEAAGGAPPTGPVSKTPVRSKEDRIFVWTMQELSKQPQSMFCHLKSISTLVGIPNDYMKRCIEGHPKIKKVDIVYKDKTVYVCAAIAKLMIIRICLAGDIHTPLCRRLLRYFLLAEKKVAMGTTPPNLPKRHRLVDQIFFSEQRLKKMSDLEATTTGPPLKKRRPALPFPIGMEYIQVPEYHGALIAVLNGDQRAIFGYYNRPDGKQARFIARYKARVKYYQNGTLYAETPFNEQKIAILIERGSHLCRATGPDPDSKTTKFLQGKLDIKPS